MKTQHDIWKKRCFSSAEQPRWMCQCGGTVRLGKPKLIETAESVASHESDGWEPEWLCYRWASTSQCPNCNEKGIAAGFASAESWEDFETGEHGVREILYPHYISPAPQPFLIPQECPGGVADLLGEAFRLYWEFPSSAIARIRSAVEELLTELKIQRFKQNKKQNKKRTRLTLHARIELFQARNVRYAKLADRIFALKWIGNEGAHSTLKHEDVLDGFDLVESLLDKLFVRHEEKLDKTAKAINARKGPLSKKRTA